ncbi:MAG: U32 family peptidase [Candidatus Gastranaerophilales bacterium]|nr:U32 family peptidase [Candidatus Gastranaerophilales bacterium]
MKSDKDLKTNLKTREFELLVPANNKNTAIRAIKAGADAVYIGYSKFGARAQAGNTIQDLEELIDFAHIYRVKVYITINTILNNDEILQAEKLIQKLYSIKADGIIIQDMGLLECELPPIPLIASTQCNNNTLEKIKFLEQTGFKRVILPREITLNEIKNIKDNTNIELECFVHGALCMSYSGQCYMSCSIGGRSANRGECAQPCRKKYSLMDSKGNFILKNKNILSLKDLNLSNYLESLILNGITSFKIEGRLKNEVYVTNTTAFYRQAIDKILDNYGLKCTSKGVSYCDFEPDLYKTFNRGYTDFNITGEKKDIACVNYSSSLGEYIGVIKDVKKNYFVLNSNVLNNGDGICFFNENKELTGTNINKTEGNFIFPSNIKGIKSGIEIYRNYNKEFENKVKNSNILRKINTQIKVRETDTGYIFIIYDEENNSAVNIISKNFEAAQNKDKSITTMKVQLSKTGETEFQVSKVDIKFKTIPFIRTCVLNEIRRNLTAKLRKIRAKNYKYKKRESRINIITYPEVSADYKANIYNDKAELFYKKRGVFVSQKAPEATKDFKNIDLMTSKYCIKNQLGICSKLKTGTKYSEPFILKDEFNKKYLVEFDCSKCNMKVSIWD